jgi:hypothetical protein
MALPFPFFESGTSGWEEGDVHHPHPLNHVRFRVMSCTLRKSGTWVQRQLINANDSVLIIFRITTHLFFGRTNSPSSTWNSDIRIEKNKKYLEKLAMFQFGVAN